VPPLSYTTATSAPLDSSKYSLTLKPVPQNTCSANPSQLGMSPAFDVEHEEAQRARASLSVRSHDHAGPVLAHHVAAEALQGMPPGAFELEPVEHAGNHATSAAHAARSDRVIGNIMAARAPFHRRHRTMMQLQRAPGALQRGSAFAAASTSSACTAGSTSGQTFATLPLASTRKLTRESPNRPRGTP